LEAINGKLEMANARQGRMEAQEDANLKELREHIPSNLEQIIRNEIDAY
jgi:hypothetical protein